MRSMKGSQATDYATFKEIMGELLNPIMAEGLELDTLKRLYESKAVYLENLRVKCFWEINKNPRTFFSTQDYQLILRAIAETRNHLRHLILAAVNSQLAKRRVS